MKLHLLRRHRAAGRRCAGNRSCGQPHRIPTAGADMGGWSKSWSRNTQSCASTEEINMLRRNVMLVIAIAAGLAMLGSSIAWSEDSDQGALIKALGGAKLTLLQGIAQVAKGTEVPIEAKYQMVSGKLMLSIYTSAKGFDTAVEDNSFNEYIGDVTTANWT